MLWGKFGYGLFEQSDVCVKMCFEIVSNVVMNQHGVGTCAEYLGDFFG